MIHTRPSDGLSNHWLTPLAELRKFGVFDLDPCVPFGMPWWTAPRMFTEFEDGLWQPWHGRVWLNPPYGRQLKKWLAKMANHGGGGIALVPARTEVEDWFWPYIWDCLTADAILFRQGRLYFHRPDGSLLGNAGHGSVYVAYGWENRQALLDSGIKGRFICLDTLRAEDRKRENA